MNHVIINVQQTRIFLLYIYDFKGTIVYMHSIIQLKLSITICILISKAMVNAKYII